MVFVESQRFPARGPALILAVPVLTGD